MPVLTPRERELLLLSALGLSTDDITTELGLSRDDVKDLKQSMRERLHAKNAAHAFILALITGDITIEDVDSERLKRGREALDPRVIHFTDAC
jgi:DNA-binding CsgD family transcriptional regulator